jgi:hypothetical protein
MAMTKEYIPVVAAILRERAPASVLDAPCGNGWLRAALTPATALDGIDLYGERPDGYRDFASPISTTAFPPTCRATTPS